MPMSCSSKVRLQGYTRLLCSTLNAGVDMVCTLHRKTNNASTVCARHSGGEGPRAWGPQRRVGAASSGCSSGTVSGELKPWPDTRQAHAPSATLGDPKPKRRLLPNPPGQWPGTGSGCTDGGPGLIRDAIEGPGSHAALTGREQQVGCQQRRACWVRIQFPGSREEPQTHQALALRQPLGLCTQSSLSENVPPLCQIDPQVSTPISPPPSGAPRRWLAAW